MRRAFAWSLAALWVGACAIPNLEVDESRDDAGGGTSNSNAGTKNGSAGTKSNSGGANSNSGDGGTGNSEASDGGSDGGVIDEGGAPAGGTNSNPGGGSPPIAGTSAGGSGGSGGSSPASGTALAKFCNAVSYQGADVDFELHVGSGADEVVLTTLTGTCTPAVNKNCVAIPTGTDVPINIYFVGDTDPYWIGSATIKPGEAWIFGWVYDETADEPTVLGNGDYSAAECKSTDYDELTSTTP